MVLLPIKELEVNELPLNFMSSLQCQPCISFALEVEGFNLGFHQVIEKETIDGGEESWNDHFALTY